MKHMNVASFMTPIALAALMTFTAGVTHAAPLTIVPGSPGGPTSFELTSSAYEKKCSAPTTACTWLNKCASCQVESSSTDGLQGGVYAFQGIGFPRKVLSSQAILEQELTVQADLSGHETVLMANVGVSFDLKGFLAAVMDANASVGVQLAVRDVTNGADILIGSEPIFADEIQGTLDPSVGVSPGVLLPVPDGEIEVNLDIGLSGARKVVDESVDGGFDLLLQRGHTYKVALELTTQAQVGNAGGLAVASFIQAENLGVEFQRPPQFTDLGLWIEAGLGGMLELPELKFSDGVFQSTLSIPSLSNVRTFDAWSRTRIVGDKTIVDFTVPAQDHTIPGQNVNLPLVGGVNNVAALLAKAGLPTFSNKMKFSEVVAWLKQTARAAEPVLTDSGLAVRTLSVTVADDLFALGQGTNKNIDKTRTEINTNINETRTEINTNIDNSRTKIISVNNENTDLILELVQMLADDALRRDVQTNLGNRQCEAWMYTPENPSPDETLLDGKLEVVIDVVQTVIDNARRLGTVDGKTLDRAQDDLNEATRLDLRKAQEICKLVLRAYETATVRPY